jgi:hypothetical protein
MRIEFLTVLALVFLVGVSTTAEDWEWNSGGAIDTEPTAGFPWDIWGTYTVTTVENDTGNVVLLTEFGFPCNYGNGSGPGDDVEWVVWLDVGGINPPTGTPGSCDVMGIFDPVDTGSDDPPTTYTYIDVTGEDILIDDGAFLCFGYQNPGLAGFINYNGVQSWTWFQGAWDPDETYNFTAILQVKGNYDDTKVTPTSLGNIKAMYY